MHRERVKVDRLVKVRNDLQHEMRRDSQMALPCVTKLNLREEELEQSTSKSQSIHLAHETKKCSSQIAIALTVLILKTHFR